MLKRSAMNRHVKALRAIPVESRDADATRMRVLRSLKQRRTERRAIVLALLLGLLGLPLGTTAYAAVFGRPILLRALLVQAGLLNPPATTKRAQRTATRSPVSAEKATQERRAANDARGPATHHEQDVAPAERAPSREPTTREASPRQPRQCPSPEPTDKTKADEGQATSARSPSQDRPERLYARAHHLHFVRHDWAAALAAWDAYLRQSSQPVLAPEASYNRALCLVRLGRTQEAIAALVPFSQGRHDGYRAREAKALIKALSTSP